MQQIQRKRCFGGHLESFEIEGSSRKDALFYSMTVLGSSRYVMQVDDESVFIDVLLCCDASNDDGLMKVYLQSPADFSAKTINKWSSSTSRCRQTRRHAYMSF
jgi:hypothetical protein